MKFGLIFRHYLKRNFKTIENLGAMLLLPIVIILLFAFINSHNAGDNNLYFYGFNIVHTSLVFGNMLFFQIFGLFYSMENLHEALSTSAQWRLKATPVNPLIFPFAALLAGWVVTLLSAVIVVVVTAIILNVYFGSLLITALTVIAVSLFAQALGVIIFLLTKNVGQGNAIGYPLSFFIGGLSGFIIPITALLDNGFTRFLERWSPLNLGIDSIWFGGRFGSIDLTHQTYTGTDMSLAIQNIAVILAIAVGLGLIGFVVGKVKKKW